MNQQESDGQWSHEKGPCASTSGKVPDGRSVYLAPTLRQWGGYGARVFSMEPVFPSKTFPNHQSIMTGLYPESHSIVSNTFFDPVLNETFHMGHHEEKWWGGEPLWATLRKQGFVTAAYFWPGSDVAYSNETMRPHATAGVYNASVSYATRIEHVVDWFTTGVLVDNGSRAKPDFCAVYFELVDQQGHLFGPNSTEVNLAIARVDTMVAHLVQQMQVALASDDHELQIIIVSDHGMAQVARHRSVSLAATKFRERGIRDVTLSPVAMFWPIKSGVPVEQSMQRFYKSLQNLADKPAVHMKAYKKSSLNERWHLKKNRRVAPVLALADVGWRLIDNDEKDEADRIQSGHDNREVWGNHGYDNQAQDMRAIFIANGTAFISHPNGLPSGETLSSVDVYEIVCRVLGAQPAPNNGSIAIARRIVRVA